MKQKATYQGRSLFFNIVFVLLNIIGLSLIVLGSHIRFEEHYLLLNFLGYVLVAISAAGIFIFEGRLMMANVARLIVGSVFIVSGLIKANDPLGFSFKLEEYFEDGALAYRIKELFNAPSFSLEGLIPYALAFSVFICVLEIVLGILTIIGGKIRAVSYYLLLLMLFFTFLTWHTSSCKSGTSYTDQEAYPLTSATALAKKKESLTNKQVVIVSETADELIVQEKKPVQCVTDCGCFGDAMKGSVGRSLTPAESLWKDIVLLYFVGWIFFAQRIVSPNTNSQNIQYLLYSLLIFTFFGWVFTWYFIPLFGFVICISALWILRSGGYFLGNYFGSSMLTGLLSLGLIFWILRHEPIKDYRPFAVGSNLKWRMNDGRPGKYANTFVLQSVATGQKSTFTEEEYMNNSKLWDEKKYRFVEKIQKEIIPARQPSITDQFNPFLSMRDLGEPEKNLPFVKDLINEHVKVEYFVKENYSGRKYRKNIEGLKQMRRDSIAFEIIDSSYFIDPDFSELNIKNTLLALDQVVIVTSRSLYEGNWTEMEAFKALWQACNRSNIPFVMLTNAGKTAVDHFRKSNKWNLPVFSNDAIGLKTIARSNPSIMILHKGIVVGKYPHRSLPTFEMLIHEKVLQK